MLPWLVGSIFEVVDFLVCPRSCPNLLCVVFIYFCEAANAAPVIARHLALSSHSRLVCLAVPEQGQRGFFRVLVVFFF